MPKYIMDYSEDIYVALQLITKSKVFSKKYWEVISTKYSFGSTQGKLKNRLIPVKCPIIAKICRGSWWCYMYCSPTYYGGSSKVFFFKTKIA